MSPEGEVRPLLAEPSGQLDEWPQYTRDGAWIVFTRGVPGGYQRAVYRARPDGSDTTLLSPFPQDFYENDFWPSPSPDGTRIVFATTREPPDPSRPGIWVREIATGVVTRLNVRGYSPRWSPTSDLIAFVSSDFVVTVIRADGTGLRALSTPGQVYSPLLDWSPDGRWVAARRGDGPIELFELETGLTLPLPFTNGLIEPTWKPR